MKRIYIVLILIVVTFLIFMASRYFIDRDPDVPDLDITLYPSGKIQKWSHDLCPPDGEATQKPTFKPIKSVGNERYQQFGNFYNEKGQIFSIKVTGSDKNSVLKYTDEILICGDILPIGNVEKSDKKDIYPDLTEKLIEETLLLKEENLVIDIDFVAVASLNRNASKEDIDKALSKISIEVPVINARPNLMRDGEFNEGVAIMFISPPVLMSATSPLADFPSMKMDYAFDFIIDPTVRANRIHNYSSKKRRQVSVTTTIKGKNGYGAVQARLYRAGKKNPRTVYVEKGGSKSLSFSSKAKTNYDFAVKGYKKSRYRTSGTWVNAY